MMILETQKRGYGNSPVFQPLGADSAGRRSVAADGVAGEVTTTATAADSAATLTGLQGLDPVFRGAAGGLVLDN